MKHISPRIVLATLGLMSVSVGFAVHAASRYTEMVDGDEISIRRPSDMDYDPFAMRPTQRRTSTSTQDQPAGPAFADPKQFIMPTASGDNGIIRLPAVRPAIERAPAISSPSTTESKSKSGTGSQDIARLPAVRIPVTAEQGADHQRVSMDVPVVRPYDAKPFGAATEPADDDIPIISAADAGPPPAVFAQESRQSSSEATSPWASEAEHEAFATPLTIESSAADTVYNETQVEAFPPVISPAPTPLPQVSPADSSRSSALASRTTGNPTSDSWPREMVAGDSSNVSSRESQSLPQGWQATENPLVGLDGRSRQGDATQGWARTANVTGDEGQASGNVMYANPNTRVDVADNNEDLDVQQTGYGQTEVRPVTRMQIDEPLVAYEPINPSVESQRGEIVQYSEALQFQDSPSDRRGTSPLEELTQTSLTADPQQGYPINNLSQGTGTPRIDADSTVLPYDSPLTSLTQGSNSIQDELMGNPFDPGTWGAPCPGGCPPKFYAKADIVAYQPITSAYELSSGISTDQEFFREGGRITFGRRGDCLVGWEASALLLSSATEVVNTNSSPIGGPLSVRFVPEGGFTNVNLTDFGAPNGLVHVQSHQQEFGTFEFNRMTWGWDVFNTMFGVRVTHFQEEVQLGGGPTLLPIETMPGLFRQNLDNWLFGPQIGMTLIDDSREFITFDFRGRLGGYINLIEADTQFVNESITYINRNNVSEVNFAASLDFSLGVAMRITRNIHVRAGLDAMYYYGMATAREQLINSGFPGGVQLSPGTGSTIQNEDDLFYLGGTLGVYGNWP